MRRPITLIVIGGVIGAIWISPLAARNPAPTPPAAPAAAQAAGPGAANAPGRGRGATSLVIGDIWGEAVRPKLAELLK